MLASALVGPQACSAFCDLKTMMTFTLQIVVVVDPVIATHILHSKMLDKHRFQYHFLDSVGCSYLMHSYCSCVQKPALSQ